MQPKELKIGVFLIRQEDIKPDDYNTYRWFLYKTIDGVKKQIGRYKTEKKAIAQTKL